MFVKYLVYVYIYVYKGLLSGNLYQTPEYGIIFLNVLVLRRHGVHDGISALGEVVYSSVIAALIH